MKKALIDTDILSYFLKGDDHVIDKVQECLVLNDQLSFSEITYFEILAGLEFKQANQQLEKFDDFVSKCSIIKLTLNSIKISAKIYGELRRKGIQMGTPDILIAGIAIENKLNLITNNMKDYHSIEELSLENWKN